MHLQIAQPVTRLLSPGDAKPVDLCTCPWQLSYGSAAVLLSISGLSQLESEMENQ